MKICYVDLFMDLECSGGSMHSLDLYSTELAKRGHEVSILTFYPKRNIGFDRKKKPYKIIEEPMNIKSPFFMSIGLKNALKKHEDFDVFHFHDPRMLLGAALYRKSGGKIPVVGDLNTYLFYRKNFGKEDIFSWPIRFFHSQRLRVINKYCDLLFPVSPIVEKLYNENGIKKEKMTMIPDGFDFNSFKIKKTDKKENTFNLLYVGRLERTKGVDVTIKALKSINIPGLKFRIAGEGPQKHNLQKLANDLGVSDKIIFHGFVDYKKMLELYSIADVFVHAARWEEPFGRAIVEAMASSLPTVVSDIGAPPWVADGACLKFTPENEKELAAVVNRIYHDKQLREKLEYSAQKRYKYFDVKNTVNAFINAYKKVINC